MPPAYQYGHNIIERKIRYDTKVVEHRCKLVEAHNQQVVLFHIIEDTFKMTANQANLTILKGSYTLAYYWGNRPYNLYIWRDHKGKYIGCYFNLVKNTCFTNKMVSFEDLIIDIMVLPNGEYFILDEEELPVPLEQFENGNVLKALNSLIGSLDSFLPKMISEAENTYKHEELLPWLNTYEI
ncbi:DUF402 domain-containing protein [Cytobacillus praedii]|uniref:DUF402 domain-containing protein n=1 Tax=Cytobacillus praedii TaxID=1742358 RepID=UPI002E1C6B40|nr:DUF402 domain-containing protein [Cytobacillus praedii]